MASASTAVSESAARKSFIPAASSLKAAPAAPRESKTLPTTPAEPNPPRFADALKAARRPPEAHRQDQPIKERAPQDPAPKADEQPDAEASEPASEKVRPAKNADRKTARRPEKNARRRDSEEAPTETPADAPRETPHDDQQSLAEDTPQAVDDGPLPAEAPLEEAVASAEVCILVAETPPEQPVAIAVQITPPPTQESAALPSDANPAEQIDLPPTPSATPVTTATANPAPRPAHTTAPTDQPAPTEPAAEQPLASPPEVAQPTTLEPKPAPATLAAPTTSHAPAPQKKSIELPEQPRLDPIEADLSQPIPHPATARSNPRTSEQPEQATDSGTPAAAPAPAAAPTLQLQSATIDATIASRISPTTPAAPDDIKPTPGNPTITATSAAAAPQSLEESAESARPAQEPHAPDPDQTFEQVVMGLRGKLDARTGKAEIRLDPPNLGPLHVSVHLKNGALTAQFQSSSDVVRDLLKTNMEKLKTVLEGQGIAVDKLAVESPVEKVVLPPSRQQQFGAPNNDGRSAGQYQRDPSHGQKRSGSNAFGKLWRQATADAPIDLVG